MNASHTQPRIVIVDDDPLVLALLSHQLAVLGFERIATLGSPREAMALLGDSRDHPDLMLCDLDMPDIDGIELLRYLGAIGYQGGVVLVSGEDVRVLQTAEKLAEAHQLRVLGALRKPISPADLSAALALQATVRKVLNPGTGARRYGADELAQGIADGQLVNYYQPVVHLSSGDIMGVETLVRWQHPDHGLVGPDQFIGLAEDHDLIDDVTRQVLTMALAQVGAWNAADFKLHVAVNLSMDNLASLQFPDFVATTAARNDVPLSRLVLEVTESRLMRNRIAALDILTRLRLKHVSLSIDDFGTGHSSLVQLRDVPFDQLKIDRSFVHGAWHDNSLRAIFEGSLSMARQLGMVTVAEGVEDAADWHFLRTTDCNLAQGYFIARPMPGDQLPAWMAHWESKRPKLLAG